MQNDRKTKFEVSIENGTGIPTSQLPLPKDSSGRISIKLLVDRLLKQLDTAQGIDLLLEVVDRFDYPNLEELIFYNTLSCYDHNQVKTNLKLNLKESATRMRLSRLKEKLKTKKKKTRYHSPH